MDKISVNSAKTSTMEGVSGFYANRLQRSSDVYPEHMDITLQGCQPSLLSRKESLTIGNKTDIGVAGDITHDTASSSALNIRRSVSEYLVKGVNACKREHGSNLIEVAFVLPLLVMLVAGAVDLGRALYYSNNLTRAASASAMYGSQNPTDVTGMENMVKADALGVPGITASASYGCECQDGTKASSSCTTQPVCKNSNPIYYVTVKASADINTIVEWPGVSYPLSISSTSTMRGGE